MAKTKLTTAGTWGPSFRRTVPPKTKKAEPVLLTFTQGHATEVTDDQLDYLFQRKDLGRAVAVAEVRERDGHVMPDHPATQDLLYLLSGGEEGSPLPVEEQSTEEESVGKETSPGDTPSDEPAK